MVNVESRQAGSRAIIIIFPAISIIVVALRCWSRRLGRNFGWDDALMVLAAILAVGESVAGFGCERPIDGPLGPENGCWSFYTVFMVTNRTVDELGTISRYGYSLQALYHPLMTCVRMSIIVFMMRLEDTRRHIQWALRAVLLLNIAYLFGTSLPTMLQCSPVEYAWNKARMDSMIDGQYVPGGKCVKLLELVLASCALSIFMDLILFPIPAMMVWNLAMPTKTKFAVIAVMSIGGIATLVSVGRFVMYYYHFYPGLYQVGTYNIGWVISIVEANTAIWAGCTPALKRLFHFLAPTYFSGYDSSDYPYSKSYRSREQPPGQDQPADGRTSELTRIGSKAASSSRKKSNVDAIYHAHGLRSTVSESTEELAPAAAVARKPSGGGLSGHGDLTDVESNADVERGRWNRTPVLPPIDVRTSVYK